jgi:uncharacterized cupredoxin-like copper-binding protein
MAGTDRPDDGAAPRPAEPVATTPIERISMTRMTRWLGRAAIGAGVAVACLAGVPAFAHGDQTHAPKAAVAKEQKPWGIAGDATAAHRTVSFTMSDDMRFTPDRLEVAEGETLRLVVHNRGQVMHEFVLGTKPDLDAHAALMVRFPDMEHDEPYMTHVAPGESGEIVWTFNRAGDFDFACLIAGHYQAGMVGKIRVLPRKES